MSNEERRESLRRERAYRFRFNRAVSLRILSIARPYYDPGAHPTPPGVAEALAAYQEIASEGRPADAERLAKAVFY